MPAPLRYAPLLVLLPGCAASGRLGAQTKLLAGDLTAEAQGTIAVGAAGSHAGKGAFVPVLTLSGGVIPRTGRGTGSFEGGGDYAWLASPAVSLRLGPRVGGAWGGEPGGYLGLRGGVAVALESPGRERTYPVVLFEALAAPGVGGDLAGTFVGGLGVSFGAEYYGLFRVPSGRPMRKRGRAVVAPIVARRAWRDAAKPALRGLTPAVRRALGRAWLREARLEHASIATFANLSMQLLACGAPPELIGGAHQAALDEVHHAKLCFGLAAAYLGEEVDPGALPAVDSCKPSLARLAVESLVEGVIGEGCAALLATRRRRAARDGTVKRVLGAIAREERRHGELAWAVVAWSVREGGARVAKAVRDAWARDLRRAPASLRVADKLAAHGLATSRDLAAALTLTRLRAAGRLDALLAGARPLSLPAREP